MIMVYANNFLGIDVGSVSTNFVVINDQKEIIYKQYLKTKGQPITAIQTGLSHLSETLAYQFSFRGVGTTGSGRHLAGVMIGADIVKNEITTHAIAALELVPQVRTIIEIGGQDSKLILLRDGIVYDFAMNTVCAAGTGSFLDRQAERLNIPIEEFGAYALQAKSPVRIAGRCAVFAESDMIHKQQCGHKLEDIIGGLCEALAGNYLNNLSKGKQLHPPVVFQGGVAANAGMVAAFSRALNTTLHIPEHHEVMGAYGAALLARQEMHARSRESKFKGLKVLNETYKTRTTICKGCMNHCELIHLLAGNKIIASWGNRCERFQKIS